MLITLSFVQVLAIARRDSPQVIEDQCPVKKAGYASFLWQILHGIALIVGLWAYLAFLSVWHYAGKWGTALPIFGLAKFALIAMNPKPEPLPAVEGEGTEKARPHWLSAWSLLAYRAIIGLADNWACAFLWFSRRYALFSGPVAGAMGLILALYAAIGLLYFASLGQLADSPAGLRT
jgi:hypothetical protein